jgi:4-aminobutyrate aminotransferase-like enzyme
MMSNYDLFEPYPITPAKITRLAGYGSVNYQVEDLAGQTYLFKHHTDPDSFKRIEAENKIMAHLSAQLPIEVSSPTYDDPLITYPDRSFSRMLCFINGVFLKDVQATPELSFNFGKVIALSHQSLDSYRDVEIEAYDHKWNLMNCLDSVEDMDLISDPSQRKIVSYFLEQFKQVCSDPLRKLPKKIIHNDLNDWNVLVSGNEIKGIIDFGDLCYAPRICDVAIAMAYLLLDTPSPLTRAVALIEGYLSIQKLDEKEIDLLYYLIAARLCVSVISSNKERSQGNAEDYIFVTENKAWALLSKWLEINPILFRNRLTKSFAPERLNLTPALILKRKKHLSSVLSLSYDDPIHMTSAAFQYMYAANGDTYLDAYNNIPHVGHCHPDITQAAAKQINKLNTNTRYLYEALMGYSERLLNYFPDALDKVIFVNSGSEAADLAIRMAQNFTSNKHLLVLADGYHGHTRMGIDISAYKFDGKGGSGANDNITVLPLPKMYHGTHSSGEDYALEAIAIIEDLLAKDITPAAFIAEPISGCGGQVPLAGGYLQTLYPYLKEQGIVCISDEVQVGFGRMGTVFWGYELYDIVPDLVVLGKPMGNGHPIGGVVSTLALSESFDNGMEFFSSFGGNPVSMQIAHAVLDVIERENLQAHASKVGSYFDKCAKNLVPDYPQIGDVRNQGLFLGLELVHPITLAPATAYASKIKNELKRRLILTGTDGPRDNVLKLKPPLCFTIQNVDQFFEAFERTLKQTPL